MSRGVEQYVLMAAAGAGRCLGGKCLGRKRDDWKGAGSSGGASREIVLRVTRGKVTNLSRPSRSLSLPSAQEKMKFFTARLCFGPGVWPAVTLALFDSPVARCSLPPNITDEAAAAAVRCRSPSGACPRQPMTLTDIDCQSSAGPQARGDDAAGGAVPAVAACDWEHATIICNAVFGTGATWAVLVACLLSGELQARRWPSHI